ncbi:MAG: response regulator [Verrucomicrobiota bacterium JB022]|nr:response regulator [Verrucomicrobiota bacterium JB022]
MSRKCIMLVDDQQIANFILRKLILKHGPEADVHDFTAPADALRAISELGPDVIFLDLNMPGIDGWGFLDRMREFGYEQPVVIVTSSTSEVDRSRALGYGNVVTFCSKPMLAQDLGQALAKVG